jgi:hypothetical protein
MNNKSMSPTTTHSMIKLSPVSQSLMKGLGVSVFETTLIYPNMASDLKRALISGFDNSQMINGSLLNSGRFINR